MSNPGAHLPNLRYGVQATALDLASQWPGTRDEYAGGNAPYVVEGRNFHGPQRNACVTFPHRCL